MAKKYAHILILAKNSSFRDRLKAFCAVMGKTRMADNVESVFDLIIGGSFQLLILDWDLIQPEFSVLWRMIDNFQPHARKIALFKSPRLRDVIAVMKAGMNDVFWENQDPEVLKDKLKNALSREKPATVIHSHISQLAECLADQGLSEKKSLFKARKEFSKTFLSQILKKQKLKHYQLASLMSVTPRTLHRQLLK
jgi:DNA-binding NtrC family response regulator